MAAKATRESLREDTIERWLDSKFRDVLITKQHLVQPMAVIARKCGVDPSTFSIWWTKTTLKIYGEQRRWPSRFISSQHIDLSRASHIHYIDYLNSLNRGVERKLLRENKEKPKNKEEESTLETTQDTLKTAGGALEGNTPSSQTEARSGMNSVNNGCSRNNLNSSLLTSEEYTE